MSTEVAKLQAVQRSLAIPQRVTGTALTEAKKHRSASPASLAGGKKRRSSSPKRKASPSSKKSKKGGKKSKKGAKKH